MNIEVERKNGTRVQRWSFVLYDNMNRIKMYLGSYIEGEQPTKRHNVRIEKRYSHHAGRSAQEITKQGVPLPDDVIAEAKQTFFDRITFDL